MKRLFLGKAAYNRTLSETIREDNTIFLLVLFAFLGLLLATNLLLFMVTPEHPLLYWPLIVVRFISKWGTFIGWPIWIIREIAAIIICRREKAGS